MDHDERSFFVDGVRCRVCPARAGKMVPCMVPCNGAGGCQETCGAACVAGAVADRCVGTASESAEIRDFCGKKTECTTGCGQKYYANITHF